ncbi:MAG: hypothetical protein WC764_02535 [Candidatus Paceibacterota bacterium]|jgi:DNA polymerase III delta subunit
MITIFYGSDRDKVQAKARVQLDELVKKQPDIQVVQFEASEENAEKIKNFAASTSLFGETYLILLRYFCETATGRELLIHLIPHLQTSSHDVIIVDGSLTKEPLAKLESAGAKLNKFMKAEPAGYAGAREVKVSHPIFAGYNIYRFSDAFGLRDKKKLWVEYETALTAGLPAEELFWKLTWQLKNMLMVAKMTPMDKSSLQDWQIRKIKPLLRNYRAEELPHLSLKLINIYHKARRGLTDFETSLERFVLEL